MTSVSPPACASWKTVVGQAGRAGHCASPSLEGLRHRVREEELMICSIKLRPPLLHCAVHILLLATGLGISAPALAMLLMC
jgi:hypothetical protein